MSDRGTVLWNLENTDAGTDYGNAMFANAAKHIRALQAEPGFQRDEVIRVLAEADAIWNGNQGDRRSRAVALYEAIEPFLANAF